MSTDRHVELVELQRLLEEASSYEERAALRKVLRDVKKGVLKPQEALEVARHQRSDQTHSEPLEQHQRRKEFGKLEPSQTEISGCSESTKQNECLDEELQSRDKVASGNALIAEARTNEEELSPAAGSSSKANVDLPAKTDQPEKSILDSDFPDTPRAPTRRKTMPSERPKLSPSRSRESQEKAPFGQSMLKKSQRKSNNPTKPIESKTEPSFGHVKLRQVNSKKDEIKSPSSKKSTENPYGKVILRQTSREELKGLSPKETQTPVKSHVGSWVGKVQLQPTNRKKTTHSQCSETSPEEAVTGQYGKPLKPMKQEMSQERTPRARTEKKIRTVEEESDQSYLRSRSATVSTSKPTQYKKHEIHPTGASDQAVQISTEDLRVGLATYINKELGSQKSLKHLLPVPLTGKGLYHSCSDPLLLCKLVNLSVRGTVDERALSKEEGSKESKWQAKTDNLVLALESARSIGCHIDDSTHDAILAEDENIITQLLLDLVKARAAHTNGADQFGSHVFSSPAVLLSIFGVRVCDTKSKPQLSGNYQVDVTDASVDELDPNTADEISDLKGSQLLEVKEDVDTPANGVVANESTAESLSTDTNTNVREQKLPEDLDNEDESYETRAAARKAAREKKRAEKQ